jgi:hypothetical protein
MRAAVFNRAKMQKGEPMAPLFVLLCRLKSSLLSVAVSGDAHRKSGVISFCFARSPVESCSPPELFELTATFLLLKKKSCKRRDGKTHSFLSGFYSYRKFI